MEGKRTKMEAEWRLNEWEVEFGFVWVCLELGWKLNSQQQHHTSATLQSHSFFYSASLERYGEEEEAIIISIK